MTENKGTLVLLNNNIATLMNGNISIVGNENEILDGWRPIITETSLTLVRTDMTSNKDDTVKKISITRQNEILKRQQDRTFLHNKLFSLMETCIHLDHNVEDIEKHKVFQTLTESLTTIREHDRCIHKMKRRVDVEIAQKEITTTIKLLNGVYANPGALGLGPVVWVYYNTSINSGGDIYTMTTTENVVLKTITERIFLNHVPVNKSDIVFQRASGIVASVDTVDEERVYVSDSEACCIHVFDAYGKHMYRWDTKCYYPGPITSTETELYVLDYDDGYCKHGNIHVFEIDGGKHKRQWTITNGADNMRIEEPQGIAVYNDRVFILDTFQFSVYVFDINGEYKQKWGQKGCGTGEFTKSPCAITIHNETVYVLDKSNRVQEFNINGTFKRQWYITIENINPVCISVSDQEVYITESLHDCILIYNIDGKFKYKWSTNGHTAIMQNDQVCVVNTMKDNSKLCIFG
jgi:hypothetical protein